MNIAVKLDSKYMLISNVRRSATLCMVYGAPASLQLYPSKVIAIAGFLFIALGKEGRLH